MLQDAIPSRYGRAKLPTMRARWNSSAGQFARAFGAIIFPGVPAEALMGFTAIATSQREETSAGEMGLYQPPRAAWRRLMDSPEVRTLLGHRPSLVNWREHVDDQTAIGLVNIRNDGRALARKLVERSASALVPEHPSDVWAVGCAFTGFSAGPSSGGDNIARYRVQISAVPSGERIGAWVRAIVAEYDSGHTFGPSGAHARNPAHSAMRLLQKLAAGRTLAEAVDANVATWFRVGFVDAAEQHRLEARLVAAAFNVRTFGV